MRSDFLFSVNATLPVFLIMLFGVLLRRIGLLNEDATKILNKYVFRCALPLLMFYESASRDFLAFFDGGYVLFCLAVTLASIFLSWLLSFAVKDRTRRGEFLQACYRSSASILGVMFAENICGSSKIVPLMVLGAVPAYNIAAVIILTLYAPDRILDQTGRKKTDPDLWKRTAKGIITNPIILGIVAGLVWSLLSLPLPNIFGRAIGSISATASPLGLISLGAAFDFSAALKEKRGTFAAIFVKLVLFVLLFVPLGILLGYRTDKLVGILIMCGSPTTISAYIMAKGFGHDGTLTASSVMLSTLLSSVTLTVAVFVLRSAGLV